MTEINLKALREFEELFGEMDPETVHSVIWMV